MRTGDRAICVALVGANMLFPPHTKVFGNALAGKIGVADTYVDLSDKGTVIAVESAEEDRVASLLFRYEPMDRGDSVAFGLYLHRCIAALVVSKT